MPVIVTVFLPWLLQTSVFAKKGFIQRPVGYTVILKDQHIKAVGSVLCWLIWPHLHKCTFE